MMQVLDRVVTSGNFSTLLLLLLVAIGAYLVQSISEYTRDATISRISHWVEHVATPNALNANLDDRAALVDHIGTAKRFFDKGLAQTALNIPWLPLFLVASLIIHPLFLGLIFAIVLSMAGVKYWANFMTRDQRVAAQSLSAAEQATLKNAMQMQQGFGIRAVGENLLKRFFTLQHKRQTVEDDTTSTDALKSALLTFFRSLTQITALSLGAFLVVRGELTAGGMIAASIIVSKTTLTLDGTFSSLSEIRLGLASLRVLQNQSSGTQDAFTEIPTLSGSMRVDNLIFPRGAGLPPRLDRISFELNPGEVLAIIGVSGSGKSTLINSLSGVEHCPIGTVFLDETEIRTLGPDAITNYIGYLPQRADLLDGTIAENISCFVPDADDEKIIKAAKIAGVHGLISALPQSYDTNIKDSPFLLSAGQQQRVALARAIYFEPKYLFLDEPNALLDADGERQLCDTLARLKETGMTIVMILHRAGIMGLADKILRLDNGKIADYGHRAEVLQRINSGKQRIEIPLNPHSIQDLHDWISAQFTRSNDTEFRQKATMVGNELFNIAGQNRGKDAATTVVFTFKFIGDNQCELTLIDPDAGVLDAKLKKMRSVIAHPEVDMLDLPPDEIALAVVMQIADDMKVKTLKDSCIYSTLLSTDKGRAGLPEDTKNRMH